MIQVEVSNLSKKITI